MKDRETGSMAESHPELDQIARDNNPTAREQHEVFASFPTRSRARKFLTMEAIFQALCQWLPKNMAAKLALHEMQHAQADDGEGSMHVFAREVENGSQYNVTASYRPQGERTNDELARIIKAPDELSASDKAQLKILKNNKKNNKKSN